ncbi:tyrosine-type recombinase/integrase [Corynebacterium sp.]|uniref:tyrosine-type recombinase/integrase n=1 Tax=Corynebacterium sp. TaxID=1720 RepID=UPI003B3BC367
MSSITPYLTSKGEKRYRVQYRAPNGKGRTKTGFKTKRLAAAWDAKNTTNMHDGSWIDPERGKMTVTELKPAFWATKANLEPGTLKAMEDTWRLHVEPVWGNRKVSTIAKTEVQIWLSENSGQATVYRRAHGILAGILDIAVDELRVQRNVSRGLMLPKKPTPKHLYLTSGQLLDLVDECNKGHVMILLLATSGMRWGEMAGLRVGDIHPEKNRLWLQRAVKWVDRKLHVGELKGKKNRIIAVSSMVMEHLREVADSRPAGEWLFGDGETPLRPLGPNSFFNRAVKACVADGRIPQRVTPHGLRHVAAGLLVSSGANVKVVQRQLGHTSAAMTLDTYTDLFDQDLDEVAASIDATLQGVVKMSSGGKIIRAV